MRKQRVVRLVCRVIIGVAWDQTNVSQLLTVPAMAVVRDEVSTTSWPKSTTRAPFCRIAFLFVLLPSANAIDNDDYHYDEKEGTGSDHNINDEGLWRCRWDHWIEGKVNCGLPYTLIILCNAVVLARVVRTDRQNGQVKPAAPESFALTDRMVRLNQRLYPLPEGPESL